MKNPTSAPQIMMFYHDLAFRYLIGKHHGEIDDALFARPLEFRKKEFLPTLPTDKSLYDEDAWNRVYDYLLKIERELERIIRPRHIAVWLHLYRRIGVTLSSRHQGKTDPATVGLVRRTAELAFARYAGKDANFKITLSGSVTPAEILGGQFVASAVALGATFQTALAMAQGVIESNQWVLTDFTPQMLVDAFWIEGLCYEHWKTAAMLRTIGKGAGIVHTGDTWPSYIERNRLSDLIVWYDKRIEGRGFFSTLAGTLVSTRTLSKVDPTRHALTPVYNIRRETARKAFGELGLKLGPEFVPNFLITLTPLHEFQESVHYLADEFENIYGYTIDDLCLAIATLAMLCLVPPGILDGRAKNEKQQILENNFIHLAQRAYKLTGISDDDLVNYAVALAKRRESRFSRYSKPGLKLVFDSLCLSPDKEKFIGLWSGGKWFPLINIMDGKLINFIGIQDLLFRLFVGVRDKIGVRGGAFEEAFRAVLDEHGFNIVHYGDLRFSDDTKREVDAAVRVNDTLILFECRAGEAFRLRHW